MSHAKAILKVCCLLALSALLAACTPLNAAPPVTEARVGIVATPLIVVVTSTPHPTATPAPTATLPYDISQFEGHWQFDFKYRLRGYPAFDDIRYSGSFDAAVALDGSLSGTGTLYTTLDQPPCNAVVRDGSALDATLTGQLTKGSASGDVVGNVTLRPRNPDLQQSFELLCANGAQSQQASLSILWPALAATDQLRFQIVLNPGLALTDLRNLNGPTGGTMHGTLSTEIRLSR